ncbi:chaplin [Streptomyces sp. NPDC059008]|uniref:chaplin n=1 Tax=Streptomyces sp. NPDC059008 TaxID=3346693 RepID=UPI0036CFE83A
MRQSLKVCVLVAAASGALGASGAVVHGDAGTGAMTSPGVLSGNSIRVSVFNPVNVCGNSADGAGALDRTEHHACGHYGAPAPAAQRPPLAPRSAAAHRRAGEPVRHRAPGKTAETAPRPGHEPRLGAVARAGASAGSALLASSGADEPAMVAGVGGVLLLGGALLLRRARSRRK